MPEARGETRGTRLKKGNRDMEEKVLWMQRRLRLALDYLDGVQADREHRREALEEAMKIMDETIHHLDEVRERSQESGVL